MSDTITKRDWTAAYQRAFVNMAITRAGWTREDAETLARELAGPAHLHAGHSQWDCAKIAATDAATRR